jgi:transcriptional antiterminator NusG
VSIEWYAVHTYVGHEEKVRTNMTQRARSLGIADKIYQVVVPSEETVEHAGGGKKEVVRRKLFPVTFCSDGLGRQPRRTQRGVGGRTQHPGVTVLSAPRRAPSR